MIVKRAHDPWKGEWSLPGGRVALGESLRDAVRRELQEETGLDVAVGAILEVFECIERDGERVRDHVVVVDYLCAWVGGALGAGDDAEDVAWVTADELDAFGIREPAATVIRKGLAMAVASAGLL